MRNRTNRWIFSTVLAMVLTIPFLLPGCTDQSGTDALLSGTGGLMSTSKVRSVLDSVVEMVNIQALAEGRGTTLDDITEMAPAFAELGAHLQADAQGLTVVDSDGATTCHVGIDEAQTAFYTCP